MINLQDQVKEVSILQDKLSQVQKHCADIENTNEALTKEKNAAKQELLEANCATKLKMEQLTREFDEKCSSYSNLHQALQDAEHAVKVFLVIRVHCQK